MCEPTGCARCYASPTIYCDRCDLLVGLPDLHVIGVAEREPNTLGLVVTVESPPAPAGCPQCGVIATGRGRREVVLVDAPSFGRPLRIVWRKRTWRCHEPACTGGAFTEQDDRIARPRGLLTARACGSTCGTSPGSADRPRLIGSRNPDFGVSAFWPGLLFAFVAQAEGVACRVGVDRATAALGRKSGGAEMERRAFHQGAIVEADVEVHLGGVVGVRPARPVVIGDVLQRNHRQALVLTGDHHPIGGVLDPQGHSQQAAPEPGQHVRFGAVDDNPDEHTDPVGWLVETRVETKRVSGGVGKHPPVHEVLQFRRAMLQHGVFGYVQVSHQHVEVELWRSGRVAPAGWLRPAFAEPDRTACQQAVERF